MPASPIRLLIIDDHPVFREALAHALEGEAGFAVVAQADDGLEAWRHGDGIAPTSHCSM